MGYLGPAYTGSVVMIMKAPIMCFDCGALKIWEDSQLSLFISPEGLQHCGRLSYGPP